MKKLLFLLTVCLLLPFPQVASADVISLPPDGFLERNYQKATHCARSYYANGAEGYVRLLNEPGGKFITTRMNGEILFITFTYDHLGKLWGALDLEGGKSEGWILMDRLVGVYDWLSFQEEYKNELYDSTKSYFQEYREGEEIYLYPYPNASESSAKFAFPGEAPDYLTSPSSPLAAYRDRDGLEWIYVPYLYGFRNVWICADDPYNASAAAYPPPMPDLIPSADPGDVPPDNDFRKELALAGTLVLFAVILSVGLFKRLRKNP